MLDIKKHRLALFNLISAIYKQPWSKNLGFKGGTMAYFFYGLSRFSVDLDFDLLDGKKVDLIRFELEKILKKMGTIKDCQNKFYTLFYLLNYEKDERNIKIEISKRLELPVNYQVANFYGIDVLTMKIEDAFATKILACLTRKKIAFRDFFDLNFYLSKGIAPNKKIIFAKTNKSLKENIKEIIKIVNQKITNKNILNAIGELIDNKEKEKIRKFFKDELLRKLKFFYDQI